MCFCDFGPLFGKPSMSWLRSKHEVHECWSHNAVHLSIQSNRSAELTNASTERPVYAPNTSRQLSIHCIKCSPSNFKIRTFITWSALSGWYFVCFFKGNMKASELKNHNKLNKKPIQTTPPPKHILYSFIIY